MKNRLAPSEMQAQEVGAMRQGQREGQSGEELLSALVRLSTERGWQEAWEHEASPGGGPGTL